MTNAIYSPELNMTPEWMPILDAMRGNRGFLTVAEVLELGQTANVILDPFSTLISRACRLGMANVFYPNVVLEVADGGRLEIGDRNVFFPNTVLLAARGTIQIGHANQFGDGGVSVKANLADARILVGDHGRYLQGVQVLGKTRLGSGSQIIGGPLTVQDCNLEDGESHLHPDPAARGGVLKGFGLARGISLRRGEVLRGSGRFDLASIERQAAYHPAGTAK